MVDIHSRAHRILKPLAAYSDFSEEIAYPNRLPTDLVLGDSERLLGIYALDQSRLSDAVVFTTEGLFFRNNNIWKKLRYDEIDRTIAPQAKTEVEGFTIVRRDGSEIWLTVNGLTGGRFSDAFEILRFVNRVRSDLVR